MEGQGHAASEISFQVPENSVTWSIKHLQLSNSALASSNRTKYMNLCFLIYWLQARNVLVVTLKLGCNILFLVYSLTLEVSCILFLIKWEFSF